jgi:hypothetical protein
MVPFSKSKREEEGRVKSDRDQSNERFRQRESELERKRVLLAESRVKQARRQESERKLVDLTAAAEKCAADIKV